MQQLQQTQNELVDLLLRKGALKTASSESGFFTLKSGRRSPVFANFGLLNDGESLHYLKKAYSSAANEALEKKVFGEFQYVFGPAYKGINLAALTCEGLFENHSRNCFCLYDRKEEKKYSEGAAGGANSADKVIVGASSWKAGSAMLLVDDVITTGKAKYDALEKISLLPGARIAGMLLAIDRQEKMGDAQVVEEESAVQAFERQAGVKTHSILSMQQVFSAVQARLSESARNAWLEYAEKYCVVKLQ